MKTKPIVPRVRANLDVDEIVAYYLDMHAADAAEGFIDALERAYLHLSRHAGTGSLRYGQELHLPNLRFWALTGYPYLVFFIERDELVDVWRVLHAQRDISAWMLQADKA